MTQHQFNRLSQAGDDFKLISACMDIDIQDVEGPSVHDAYLVRETNGKVWLFGKPQGKFGRVVVPSVWSPLNVSIMRAMRGQGAASKESESDRQFLDNMNELTQERTV